MLDRIDENGELNRMIKVIKSRGSDTSKQVKEYNITGDGIQIENPYIGKGVILYGSAKSEMIEENKNRKKTLEKELITIESGIEILKAYSGTEGDWRKAKMAMLKHQLIEKHAIISVELDNVINSEQINKDLRGGDYDKI